MSYYMNIDWASGMLFAHTQVLERKVGIPISMCTVYQSIASRLGVTLLPVSDPFSQTLVGCIDFIS